VDIRHAAGVSIARAGIARRTGSSLGGRLGRAFGWSVGRTFGWSVGRTFSWSVGRTFSWSVGRTIASISVPVALTTTRAARLAGLHSAG